MVRLRWRVVTAVLLAALSAGAVAGCGGGASGGARPAPTGGGGGLLAQQSGQTFFVSDQTAAARQLARTTGADAKTLARIADQPSALWLGGQDARAKAEDLTLRATAAGRTALIVAYDIPHRDCGQFSAGGAADAPAYRAWIDQLAAGLADRAAWVVLEPDAVAHTLDSCGVPPTAATERYELLTYAVRELKKHPKVRVYLDAGNAGWLKDQERLAGALRGAGVAEADGFSVNVSNFYTTEQSSAYGDRLSALLDGKHYVIDTSRNGNGPLGDRDWCNPAGRALGESPTTETGRPGVDAYLWIKNPGESDGDCGRGEPRAGDFWLGYALGLAHGSS
ncbi:glycoside hydrolase family 6 protein [Kitasatospora sp. GP82]|uniref:glycoside hydrolase family 6 protein n=1 Tax=Kitasatospora sp. GP82 TaxID=3035089 RepID=UPI002475B1A8|nr:glycoside hydrolase family 6 protein [Kitasatospora sp. GP82]MDH6126604.1 endoglucanase [Kitasatospora sp. GP82]